MSEGKSGTKNCLMYGCLTMVIMGIVVILITVFGARYGFRKLVSNYTSATPAQMPVVQYTPAELTTLTNRLEAFKLEANAQTNTVTLMLNAQDINTLMDALPELQPYKNHLRVEIHDNTIKSQISLPLDKLEIDAVKGRFLNGTADVKVKVIDGRLDVRLEGMAVNGLKATGSFMAQLQNENIAKDIKFDPQTTKALQRVESLTVENGQMILKLKALNPAASTGVSTNAVPPPPGTI
jgi:hypothetical protein